MIDVGDTYEVPYALTDPLTGQPVNAASITLTITLPDGTTAAPAVTNPPAVTGQYLTPYVTTQAGRHVARYVTTSPATAYTDVFDVAPQPLLGIVSLADAKLQLGIYPSETDDDDELRAWIEAMTGPVELYKNEVIVQRQFTQTFRARHASRFRLYKVPVVSLDSLAGTIWGTTTYYVTSPIPAGSTSGAYFIDPDTGLAEQIAAGPPALAGHLTATWTAGYQVIPQHILNACTMLLQALWETRRGPGGTGGVIGPEELGDYRHFEALPRKVRELLGPPRPVVL